VEEFARVLRSAQGVSRDVKRYAVLDTTEWAATGASFVTLLVDGVARRAIYRDGPVPLVGTFLQAVKTGDGALAPLLALPLPQPLGLPCDMEYYFRVNGRLAAPPTEIPPNVAGKTVLTTMIFTPRCHNIYYRMRSYVTDTDGVILSQFQQAQGGPVNGPLTATVAVAAPLSSYFLVWEVRSGPFPGWPDWPPAGHERDDFLH